MLQSFIYNGMVFTVGVRAPCKVGTVLYQEPPEEGFGIAVALPNEVEVHVPLRVLSAGIAPMA